MDRLKQMLGAMGDGIGRVDDFVQGGVRDHILRLPNNGDELPDDARLGGLREALGYAMHQHRSPEAITRYKRHPDDQSNLLGIIGSRAAQVGGLAGVTAADAALLNTGEGLKDASKPQFEP